MYFELVDNKRIKELQKSIRMEYQVLNIEDLVQYIVKNNYEDVGLVEISYEDACMKFDWFEVFEAYRNQGIGLQMLNEAIQNFRKDSVYCLVVPKSDAAMKFWRKNGFEKYCDQMMRKRIYAGM